MIPPIAKVVYEARRAVLREQDELQELEPCEPGDPVHIGCHGAPFDELTSAEREPLLAEVQAYLQSGTPMNDALGQAIVDALK